MMPYLKQIYHEDFFKQWGIRNNEYVQSAKAIVDLIYERFSPGRVVDFGCGCGVYTHFLQKKGVQVLALDGVIPPKEESYPIAIELVDLTVPFENRWGDFDLGLCFEVAEHIPRCFDEVFLRNLTQFSDTLLLSCAPPNQEGTFHVNLQPKRYWVQKLSQMDFIYDRTGTGKLQETFKARKPRFRWMCDQISVYRRIRSREGVEKCLPFKIRL